MRDWMMSKLPWKLSGFVILLVILCCHENGVGGLPTPGASASPEPEGGPDAQPDIIPGRVQNNPVLLIYDLLANLVASLVIIGIALVEILGLGR